MSPEGDALLRAVLDDPDDDLPRLAYADWLDEHGEDDRAGFIRCQLRLSLIGHRPGGCGDRTCPCARLSRQARELSGAGSPSNALAWTAEPLAGILTARYRFTRGFVGEVSLTTTDYRRHVQVIFSRHPVVEVTLLGRRPLRQDGLFWWLAERGEVTCEGDYAAVPAPLFNLLAPAQWNGYGGEGPLLAGYEDPDDALADLSLACVAWGRRLAGLSPLQV